MTQKEISTFLGYSNTTVVASAVNRVKETHPELKNKKRMGPGVEINYTLDECLLIAEELQLSEIQIELLKSNFIHHDTNFISHKNNYIDGMEKFLDRFERNSKTCNCCDTCIYIQGRSITHKTALPRPYCSFYKRYLSTVRIEKRGKMVPVNIFTDRCESFQKANTPYIFYKKI